MQNDLDELIATTLKIPQEQLSDTLEYGSIQQWDSLSHVNLMLRLEDAYGIEIDEDTMIELTSVRAIRDFVREQA
jgi:citrate synthase